MVSRGRAAATVATSVPGWYCETPTCSETRISSGSFRVADTRIGSMPCSRSVDRHRAAVLRTSSATVMCPIGRRSTSTRTVVPTTPLTAWSSPFSPNRTGCRSTAPCSSWAGPWLTPVGFPGPASLAMARATGSVDPWASAPANQRRSCLCWTSSGATSTTTRWPVVSTCSTSITSCRSRGSAWSAEDPRWLMPLRRPRRRETGNGANRATRNPSGEATSSTAIAGARPSRPARSEPHQVAPEARRSAATSPASRGMVGMLMAPGASCRGSVRSRSGCRPSTSARWS